MSTTTERRALCADGRHEDPDNTGLCIRCGGIMDPDEDDWVLQPERCIGQRNPQDKALANIAACRDALKAFLPIASPDLMRELTDAVDRYEDQVREFNGLRSLGK